MSSSQLFNFRKDSYLDRTSRPIFALLYLLPLIAFYEIGTILINPESLNATVNQGQVRVVSFVWVQNLLEYLGFSLRMTWVAVPLVVIIILLAMQMTSGAKWRIRGRDFLPTTLECIALTLPLIVLSLVVSRTTTDIQHGSEIANRCGQVSVVTLAAGYAGSGEVGLPSVQDDVSSKLSGDDQASDGQTSEMQAGDNKLMVMAVNIVTGIGAGIYEELVFRLIFICLLMLLFQDILHVSPVSSVLLSVTISAVLFSAHHHIYFVNGRFSVAEYFSFSKFFFRFLAGIYFAIIFAIRGFGVTAGTHAAYDIIAALMNTFLFHDGE